MKTIGRVILWMVIGLAAVSAIALNADYQGNATRHFIMEVLGTFLAVTVSILAFNAALDKRDGLTRYVGVAFLAAGLTDLLHALFAVGILLPPQAALDRFIPGTWTMGRITFGAILLFGLFRTQRDPDHRPSMARLGLGVSAVIAITVVFLARFPLPALIRMQWPLIHRPWELFALLLYVACSRLILRRRERRGQPQLLLPPLFLAIVAQALMACSSALFDRPFDGSHVLKDVSYAAALVPFALILGRKARFSLHVTTAQMLSAASIVILTFSIVALISLAILTETSRRSEEVVAETRLAAALRYRLLASRSWIHDYLISGEPTAITQFEQAWASVQEILGDAAVENIESEHGIDFRRSVQIIPEYARRAFALSDPVGSRESAELNAEMERIVCNGLDPLMDQIVAAEEAQGAVVRQEVERQVYLLLLGLLGVIVLLLPLLYILGAIQLDRQVMPILQLTDVAGRVREGDRDIRAGTISKDETGTLAATFNSMLDALQEGEKRVKTILDAAHTGIVVVGPQTHTIVDANRAAAEMIGAPRERIIGSPCHKYLCPGKGGQCPVTDLGQSVDNSEDLLRTASGDRVTILKTVVPVTLGGQEHLLESFVDITERKRVVDELRERTSELEQTARDLGRANIKLQELDRLKSMFIANMSHELRTPLNSIIGFTGIILMGMAGEVTEEQSKQLTMVKNSAKHLLALVNDIIDSSKIEAGKAELLIEEFDLSNVLQEVKDSFRVAVEEEGLRMSLEAPERLPIQSDERRVKQIIVNLVANAVKFTEDGEIEIRAAKAGEGVEVSVRDTGPGIRNEHMDRLFKAFSQIPNEGELKEGTGLGLYLSKKIADLLGGRISAESEFGKGSKFTFTVPLKHREPRT